MGKLFNTILGLGLAIAGSVTTANAASIVLELNGGGDNATGAGATNNTSVGPLANGGGNINYNMYEVGLTTAPVIASLTDTTGGATGISVTRSSGAWGYNSAGAATITAPANAMFPTVPVGAPGGALPSFQTSGFLSGVGATGEFTFSNLDPSATYTFEIFSSRATGGTRTSEFDANGVTGSINSANNSSAVVTLANVVPNGSNTIVLKTTVGANDGQAFAYLNVLRLTSNTTAVPEPTTLALCGLAVPMLVARRRHAGI